MSQIETDFWNFVARERAALEQVEKAHEETPDILSWLEQEIRAARDAAFSAMLRQEAGAEYWTGYADALEGLKRAIQRREVRA